MRTARQWVLYARKVPGTPYGGTWQARRSGRWRDLWATWREERGGRREFDRFRVRRRTVDLDRYVILPK